MLRSGIRQFFKKQPSFWKENGLTAEFVSLSRSLKLKKLMINNKTYATSKLFVRRSFVGFSGHSIKIDLTNCYIMQVKENKISLG